MKKIDKTHRISVSRQCDLLDVPGSSFYYSPLEDGSYNEELMKQIDGQTPQGGRACHPSVLAAGDCDRPSQPGLGDGYQLYPISGRAHVSGSHH